MSFQGLHIPQWNTKGYSIETILHIEMGNSIFFLFIFIEINILKSTFSNVMSVCVCVWKEKDDYICDIKYVWSYRNI